MALYYLSKRCVSFNCNSPYNLALIAFTLSRAVGYDEETDKALKTLQKCAVKVGDHTHWQYSIEKTCHNPWPWSYYCRTSSCDVEATAYALLAFTDRGNIAYSLQIVRWLIKQRNPRGGFKSTQVLPTKFSNLRICLELKIPIGNSRTRWLLFKLSLSTPN